MEELQQKVQQLTEENQNLKMDNQADMIKAKSAAEINAAKTASDIKIAEFKAQKEIELKQATAAVDVQMAREKNSADVQITREKMGADVEIGREKVRGDHAIKSEGELLTKRKEAESSGKNFDRIAEMVAQMGKDHAEQMKMLTKIMAADTEIVKGPDGKAAGARKRYN